MQYRAAFKPSFLDLFPRGRYSFLYVLADAVLVNLILFFMGKINQEALFLSLVTIVAVVAFFVVPLYVNGKELEEARADISKARAIIREKGMFDAEREAHVARIEMELQGLRARVKRHHDSVDLLVNENRNLKKNLENLKRENREFARKLDNALNLAQNEDDSDGGIYEIKQDKTFSALVQENQQLKNMNDELSKLVEIQKLRNADLLRRQRKYRFSPENEWMGYIPYAAGDSFADIKKAYRSLAKAHHPDTGDGNEEKIRKLNEAFEQAEKWFNEGGAV